MASAELLGILGFVLSVGNTAFQIYKWAYKPSPTFFLQRFQEKVEKPVQSVWSIRLHYPDKPIEKCKILFNETPLPWWDNLEPPFVRSIVVGGGGNVRIPVELYDEKAEVKVMDGTKTLRRISFKDVAVLPRSGGFAVSLGKRPR
jgi:hypothetical protein